MNRNESILIMLLISPPSIFSETPLTVATGLQRPRNVIIALFSGGAHLDFQAKDGETPMHRSAARGNYEAIKVT